MGVGTPDDLLREPVTRGIDMFDCVMPTRAGRHGLVFTRHGRMNLRNARFADDARPIDEASSAPAGARFFARLLAPSRQIRRNPRDDGAHRHQPRLLSGPDGRRARRDRRIGGLTNTLWKSSRGWEAGESEGA